jgi:hypothetical protein
MISYSDCIWAHLGREQVSMASNRLIQHDFDRVKSDVFKINKKYRRNREMNSHYGLGFCDVDAAPKWAG